MAAHFTAAHGARNIHGLNNEEKPRGALALSAATVSCFHDNINCLLVLIGSLVERALSLIASGIINIEQVNASRGKAILVPKTRNPSTGKDSTRETGFNKKQ